MSVSTPTKRVGAIHNVTLRQHAEGKRALAEMNLIRAFRGLLSFADQTRPGVKQHVERFNEAVEVLNELAERELRR